MINKRVLVVEDDKSITKIIKDNLEDNDYITETLNSGLTALKRIKDEDFDLLILDLSLPDIDGLQVCTRLREFDPVLPIMILTARGNEMDRVMGLELGADDYMTKPFGIKELVARVRALIRRSERVARPIEDVINYRDMEVNFTKRVVHLKGREIDLTVKEFELLSLFLHNPGRTFSRSELLNRVWGYQFEGYEHTVNTHINRLRKKIERNIENPEYLLTVWGVGYKFSENLH